MIPIVKIAAILLSKIIFIIIFSSGSDNSGSDNSSSSSSSGSKSDSDTSSSIKKTSKKIPTSISKIYIFTNSRKKSVES